MHGDDGYSLLYATEVQSAVGVMMAAFNQVPIQIGFSREGQTNEALYFGQPVLNSIEAIQLKNCITELETGIGL